MPKQVFISYAHADNLPLDDSAPGWVSCFVDKLQRTIARQAGGGAISFWMDHRLEPQRKVNDELRRTIFDSEIVLAVLSPRYLESEWCQREMQTFVEAVGAGVLENRVFLVEVLPTPRSNWHTALRDLSTTPFWTSSFVRPEPKTMGWPFPNVKADYDYWDEVNSLASILARQILNLAPLSPEPPVLQPSIQSLPDSMPARSLPLSVVINADSPDNELARKAQALLGDLDVDAIIAPQALRHQLPAVYREQFESTLRNNHGVMIIYGEAPPSWVQAKYGEVRKVLANERNRFWIGLLEGPPCDKPVHGLPQRNLLLLDCRQGVTAEQLNRFVRALREGGAHV